MDSSVLQFQTHFLTWTFENILLLLEVSWEGLYKYPLTQQNNEAIPPEARWVDQLAYWG